MKKMRTLLLGTFLTITVFLILSSSALAASPIMATNQYRIEEANGWTHQYTNQNRLTINKTGDFVIEGTIQYQYTNIMNKEFSVEITEASGDLNMNMTCTEEQEELGLLKGQRVTARNRNRFQYQEGFVVNITCNSTQIQARLRIRANQQNRDGTWAYYNGETEEWVPVQSSIQDGYLVADTDHFSVWSVIIPEVDYTLWIILGGVTAAIAVLGTLIYLMKKRK
ncbi:MAG: hypothetical protein GF317_04485 [Candidatus Lokiarchaeota archaeon]|nr:hypothetical protein [Candidatus Lokiarchaeota archaeon]MBD3199147.1 hypothetical protein [Candidatus Lokiarchaeota archaeon]